ncbi:MAG: hypothetical protein K0S42_1904 [Microvirga sp.]|nr:hypothetical protein [Microvirga sp.]
MLACFCEVIEVERQRVDKWKAVADRWALWADTRAVRRAMTLTSGVGACASVVAFVQRVEVSRGIRGRHHEVH